MRRLLTLPISHYCEKARWALDRAGLAYREERHVQGIHQLVARRAGGGTTLPVLVDGSVVLTSSESILRYADEGLPPEHRLFPADPRSCEKVVHLCRHLDAGLGPDGRRWIYAQMLPLRSLVLRYNNQGVPRWEDRFMTAAFPLVEAFARRHLIVTATTIADDGPRVMGAFDEIAARLADGRPFLCGERFSAADLTFAALAAPMVVPPSYGVTLPQPAELPAALAASIEAFRAHPAGAYALELFRTQRVSRPGSLPA